VDERRARLIPVFFGEADDPELVAQLGALRELLGGVAELLDPQPIGSPLPDADAVLFAQLIGECYHRVAEIAALSLPVLVLTSEFATMAMWDWEIISYLRGEGIETLAPYSLAGAQAACRALAARRALREGRFLVYQDRPGDAGQQPSIFKRFYWWEDECAERIRERFGLTIERRSFRELGARAQALSDAAAGEEWERLRGSVPLGDVSLPATLSALKLYHAIRDDLDGEPRAVAAGINCLNESASSDTTPCLAWSLLYQERDLIWGCEGDTVSMLTKFILHRTLRAPILMTNLYPFLMGHAALKHERIPAFPEVAGPPEDYVLAAHCGYLGVVPQAFTSDWELRGRVLPIVNENAAVIDARLPLGELTLAKLGPTFDTLAVAEGALEGYAGWPGSDCRNGAVIRVPDGHALMSRLPSHHSLLVTGHHTEGIGLLARIFGLELDRLS